MRNRELARARRQVDREHVLVTAAVEAAQELVFAVVAAEAPPALLRADRHVPHRLVRQSEELLRRHAIFGDVVVRPVARFLDLLLGLQPRILVVPQHEIDLLVAVRRVRGGAAVTRCRPSVGGRIGGRLVRFVLVARLIEAEEQRLEVVGPERIAVGADRHALGH